MALPLLSYSPRSQNQRVTAFEVPGDDQPRIYSTDNMLSPGDLGDLIEAAYRQIFFHAFAFDRDAALETQLRYNQITVRGFIRGLLLSETFKRSFYDLNNNYRFAEHLVEKVLGRSVYSQREKIAWSIVVATKGIVGIVDALLNSDEYLENFGENIVPYHRRRILHGQEKGELPFNIKSPRYDAYYRSIFGFPQAIWQSQVRGYVSYDRKPKVGDPSQFLSMARDIAPRGSTVGRVSTALINIEASVPYRRR